MFSMFPFHPVATVTANKSISLSPFCRMENFVSYLPLDMLSSSSSLSWPPQAVKILQEIEGGQVERGHDLYLAIVEVRKALSLLEDCAYSFPYGCIQVFNLIMTREESRKWFKEVIPTLANLLLRFPSLLETHYQNADVDIHGDGAIVTTALRILDKQQPGVVFLSQELVAALLGCSLFCLFPEHGRSDKHLPRVNFDQLFVNLVDYYCSHLLDKIHSSGLIEDQSDEAIEVYFAGKNLGADALSTGLSKEEIRFMLSPEVIAGMLFLPAMEDNEAIEIVGVERFLTNAGYESSFRFSNVYVDQRDVDTFGRRKTKIVVVDALCSPKMRQYAEKFFLREINKAFCGFLDQCKYQLYHTTILQENQSSFELGNNIGVATGDTRESDILGKDPETKAMIQWLAASQAQRPFVAYCTFGSLELQKLGEVANWISSQRWTVGYVWNMLIEYSTNRSKGETNVGFFQWLLQKHGFLDPLILVVEDLRI